MIGTPVPPGGLRWRHWWRACRPATLWAAVAPVLVGTACAKALACFDPGPALAAMLGAIWIQIGTNFANDLFDHDRGTDTAERVGPTRAVQAGWISRRAMLVATWIAFLIASLFGLYLTLVAGPVVIVIGVVSVASGVAYTGGPWPLGYHGMGDLFVLLFFGFVAVVGTVFVQCGSAPALAWWTAVPVGALATAMLAINNLRDRQTDEKAGKRTLAVRFGAGAVRSEILALLVSAYGGVVVVSILHASAWCLLPLLSMPLAIGLARRILRQSGAALNSCLAGVARLLLLFSVLLSVGLVVDVG